MGAFFGVCEGEVEELFVRDIRMGRGGSLVVLVDWMDDFRDDDFMVEDGHKKD